MLNNKVIPIRLGALALGLGGVFLATATTIENSNLQNDLVANPAGAAQTISVTNYQLWAGLMIAYYTVTIFGWLGLYLYLSKGRADRTALWGTLLTILGMLLILPCWGVWSYAASVSGQRFLQGSKEAVTVYKAMEDSTIFTAFGSLPFLLAGMVLLCVAVWQDKTLPKAAMLLLTISTLLKGPYLPGIAIIIDGVVLALAALWLAYSIWQQTSTRRVSEIPAFNPTLTR